MSKMKQLPSTQTPSQQLGSQIKSAREIMRKDKGLNGDLDRLPMLVQTSAELDALLPSILDRAFKGALASTEVEHGDCTVQEP